LALFPRASNFAQTSAVNGRKLPLLRGLVAQECAVSKADQFRQYAEEAMRWAYQSKTEKDKQTLIDLAGTWTQAAVQSEHIFGNSSPPEVRAP
jgi:hypothetical protein